MPQLERSTAPQWRARAPQQKIPRTSMKIPCAATKTRCREGGREEGREGGKEEGIWTRVSLMSKPVPWASVVAQWLRIHLPMQGTRVRSLIREDPTCCGTTKPVRHNYWGCALEPVRHNYWACTLESVLCNKRSHHNEKPAHRNEE